MMTQTLALLLDAYRELNAKRLFWVVLFLSLMIVAAIASVGIDDKGLTFLTWNFDTPMFSTKVFPAAVFYKAIVFIPLGFNIWLTWAATILALISTSSIIPDFIASGAVELSLSRPIGRLRLFLTKYLCGLLFVALQVIIFSAGCFVVIGLRAGSWEPRIFLAVPLVLLFFSYLFSCCVLFGMLTRSTIASLILTILVWCAVFLVHTGESEIVLALKIREDDRVVSLEKRVEQRLATIAGEEKKLADKGLSIEPALATAEGEEAPARAPEFARIDRERERLAEAQRRLEESRKDQRVLTRVHTAFFVAKTILPKTTETMGLLGRSLTSMSDLQGFRDLQRNDEGVDFGDDESGGPDRLRTQEKKEEIIRGRSLAWILGTSLAFEAAVLGLACWIFCRRDF